MDRYLRPDYDRMDLIYVLIVEINKKRPRRDEMPNFINLEGNEEHISKVESLDYSLLTQIERRKST